MRNRTAIWLFAVVSSAVLSLALGAPAIGGSDDPSCSQFQSPIEPGPTLFTAHGSTRFTASQIVPHDLGGGLLTWNLKGQVTGANENANPGTGDLTGFLDWTIDWNQDRPDTSFHSSCVALVNAKVGHVAGIFDGVFSNFPPTSNPDVAVPEGSLTTQGDSQIGLDRVSPQVADLSLFSKDVGECATPTQTFIITRPSAPAPGHKTGNGGRQISCGD